MSEWGPWSPCSVEKCDDFGVEERHRVVLGHPVNGGLKCPHLLQSKQCQALSCEENQPEGSNNKETTTRWRQQQQQHFQHHYPHHTQQQDTTMKDQRKTFVGDNKGIEHSDVLQSQHQEQEKQKQQQKQSNQRRGMSKQEPNKNEELVENKQGGEEPFNKHYHYHKQNHFTYNRKQEKHLRKIWKGKLVQ